MVRGGSADDWTGSAFNQLAVISTYLGDDLLCVYYYFRAMAVRQAFKNVDEILEKFLRKVYERWHLARGEQIHGESGEDTMGDGMQDEFRKEYLVIVSILYRGTG